MFSVGNALLSLSVFCFVFFSSPLPYHGRVLGLITNDDARVDSAIISAISESRKACVPRGDTFSKVWPGFVTFGLLQIQKGKGFEAEHSVHGPVFGTIVCIFRVRATVTWKEGVDEDAAEELAEKKVLRVMAFAYLRRFMLNVGLLSHICSGENSQSIGQG